jgi:hypothetical protein
MDVAGFALPPTAPVRCARATARNTARLDDRSLQFGKNFAHLRYGAVSVALSGDAQTLAVGTGFDYSSSESPRAYVY